MRERAEYAFALLVLLVGAAGALLISTRNWQSVLTPRPRPFRDDVLHLNGRTVDAAPTAVALVALAGVIAVIATRGLMRRVIGAVIALAGLILLWRSVSGLTAVGAARAESLVQERHVEVGASVPHVSVTPAWAVLSAVCGGLVVLAGLLVARRGHHWGAMSAKYDSPSTRPTTDDDVARAQARAEASMWSALDRGDDPTRVDPS
ncbi:MAG: Trp biosynthesis-associated membrane protein [Jatrophihabitantaceae bacterium]